MKVVRLFALVQAGLILILVEGGSGRRHIDGGADRLWSLLQARNQTSNLAQSSCCTRSQHHTIAGHDSQNEAVFLDTGKCRRKCPLVNTQQTYQSLDQDQTNQCPMSAECLPTRGHVEEAYLTGGKREWDIIRACGCVQIPSSCTRLSWNKIYFPDSPYQTTVDVGRCLGACQNGYGCTPIKVKDMAIQSPNGFKTVEVIEDCACSSSCYRMSYVTSSYDIITNATTGSTHTRTIEIDVGRCAGTCQRNSHKCVMRSQRDPSICLMSLVKTGNCQPLSYRSITLSPDGLRSKSLFIIEDCGCN